MDLILLEDNDLQDIFDIINSFQIVFHPYYLKEGKFKHYDEFLRNKKDKIILLDRNMVSLIFDYFKYGKLKSEQNMVMILCFLLYCNVNRLQYNVGIAMNEYAEFQENKEVVNQLNEVLTFLSEIPSMKLMYHLKSGNYEMTPIKIPIKFQRHYNYKFKSDYYLLSYCCVLKMSEIFLKKELSKKEKILQYLEWHYDNLEISKYDITYAILLLTNYPKLKAPKNINSSYDKFIKGCRNQAWDISYLTIMNNFQQNTSEYEYFFATNDSNLKLVFMACNFFENSWVDIIRDRLSKKDSNEILDFIEEKMKNRVKPDCSKERLIRLADKLEEEYKNINE